MDTESKVRQHKGRGHETQRERAKIKVLDGGKGKTSQKGGMDQINCVFL